MAKTSLVVATLVASFFAPPATAWACTVCTTGDDTPTAIGAGVPYAGRLRFGLDVQHRTLASGTQGIDRIEASEQWVMLRGAYAPTAWVSLAVAVPLLRRDVALPNLARDIAYGVGDTAVTARFTLYRDRTFEPTHLIGGRLTAELPTAPRRSRDGRPLPIDRQLGSGGLDGRVGVDYALLLRPAALFAAVTFQASTPGFNGTRRGPLFLGSMTGQWTFADVFGVRLGAGIRWEGALVDDRGEADPHQGGVALSLVPALFVRPVPNLFVAAVVEAPAWTALRGSQELGPTFRLEVVWDA